MDRSFNFFKTKIKKDNPVQRNTSKSNSSKGSHHKFNQKIKANVLKPAVLTRREVQIRQAIEIRFERSKVRGFQFARLDERSHHSRKRSNSNQMAEYRHLQNKNIFDLKQYHTRPHTPAGSPHSSQDSKKFNLRFKMKDSSASGGIVRTEGNESTDKHPYLNKIIKNITPNSRLTSKGDEWKFISIQLKEDTSKPKTRKTEVKISSHRAYNFNQPRDKPKCNSAYGKYTGKKMPDFARQSNSRF